MRITPVKTRSFQPPKDDLFGLLDEHLGEVKERSVVAVTSKVVAIHQGRCVPGGVMEKETLAIAEADWYAPRETVPGEHLLFTLKYGHLVASAGIDASNGNGYYILWPTSLAEMARQIYDYLKHRFNLAELGVVITDSRVIMRRRGTIGTTIASFGFEPVKPYVGESDVFGRPFKSQHANMAESLGAACVLAMGEGGESTPLAVVEEVPGIVFSEDFLEEDRFRVGLVDRNEDLFRTMLEAMPWEKGEGGISHEEIELIQDEIVEAV